MTASHSLPRSNGEASIDTQPSTGIKLAIIAEEGDPFAEVDGLELFDLTKPENWKYFGEGYTESRRTIVLEGSLHKEARGFLETCLARAKDIAVMQSGRYAFRQSRWMLGKIAVLGGLRCCTGKGRTRLLLFDGCVSKKAHCFRDAEHHPTPWSVFGQCGKTTKVSCHT